MYKQVQSEVPALLQHRWLLQIGQGSERVEQTLGKTTKTAAPQGKAGFLVLKQCLSSPCTGIPKPITHRLSLGGGEEVTLQVWDRCGGRGLPPPALRSFYRDAVAAVLVYDVSRPETLDSAAQWVKELRKYAKKAAGGALPTTCFRCYRSNRSMLTPTRGPALRSVLVCTRTIFTKGRSIFSRSTENGPAFP